MKCGPCKKCIKRAEDMQSTFLKAETVRLVNEKSSQESMLANLGQGLRCFVLMLILAMSSLWKWDASGTKSGEVVRAVNTRPGTQKQTEETLSRAKHGWAGICALSQLRKKQEEDAELGFILSWKVKNERPKFNEVSTMSPAVRHYWSIWDSIKLKEGVLYKEFCKKDGTNTYLQLLVPRDLKKAVLYQMHNALSSGHLGRKKTRHKVKQVFYWYEMREDINAWVASCDVCSATKAPNRYPKAPLGTIPVGAPMDRLFTDLLGPLPETPRGNKYILVVTDHFTKWVEIFAVPDQMAQTCASVILNEVIMRFGCPYDLHSDQGRNYESEVFKELCRLLEVRKTRSSPRHPEGNGQAERFMKTLTTMIKSYIKDQSEWDLNLGCIAGAYRAAVHETTGFTPNMLMFGREVRMPVEVMFSSFSQSGEEIDSYGVYVNQLRSQMQKAHAVARKHLQTASQRQKQCYDVKANMNEYKPGDVVWYLCETKKINVCPKLQPAYQGPYVITRRLGSLDFAIRKEYKGKELVVHHNKLKPYKGDCAPLWAKKFKTK